MQFERVVHCSKCQEPIVPGESSSSVCFKIPGKEGYQLFHNRFRGRDCWEAYLKEGRPA